MERDIKDIYQNEIIAHNKNPHNQKKIENPTHHAEGYNPLCGDHLHVYLNVNKQQIIDDVSFESDCCAIATAAASMMTIAIKDQTIVQAEYLTAIFHKLIHAQILTNKEKSDLDQLKIFEYVNHFPARKKCAELAWQTMLGAIDQKSKITTE